MDSRRRLTLSTKILVTTLLMGAATLASAVTLTRAVGLVNNGTNVSAQAFVIGDDGNLWVHLITGPGSWVNLGKPPGVSSLGLALATGQDGSSDPLAYILGGDGNVWMKQLYKGSWLWINTGKPPAGVTVTAGIGATVSGGGRPMVFALGSDGNVWQDYWNGSHWGWTNLSHPGGVTVSIPAGALVNSGGNTMAFVAGSDGNLWQLYWNGSNWTWNNKSRPSSAALVKFVGAASIVTSKDPFVQFEGSDNSVWECYYNASASQFQWFNRGSLPFSSSQGTPAGAAMYGETAYVFDSSTSYLYSYGYPTANPQPPTSPSLSFPVGAISSAQSGNINMGNYVAAVYSDGNLWVSRDSFVSGNSWINLGHP